MASTVKFNTVCPKCFSERGVSVRMSEEKGKYFCSKDTKHQFKKNKDGFFEVVETW